MSAKRARLLHSDLNRDLVAADAHAGLYVESGRLVRRQWKDGRKLASQSLGQGAHTLEVHIDTAMGALVHLETARNGYRVRKLALPGLKEIFRRELQADGEPLGITSHLGLDTVSIWFRDSQGILERRFDRRGRPFGFRYNEEEGVPVFGDGRRLFSLVDRTPLPARLIGMGDAPIEPSALTLLGEDLCFAQASAPGRIFLGRRTLKVPGVVQTLQADHKGLIWGVTLHEGAERIFVVKENKIEISAPFNGKLYLSVLNRGIYLRTRSNLNGLEVFRLSMGKSGLRTRCLSRQRFGRDEQRLQSRTHRIHSGPWIIERSMVGVRPRGLLIHLHGGPDAFEVDDLRFWGLFHECVRGGMVVISLNYAGSIGFGLEYQQQAWRRWSPSIQADFRKVLKYARSRFQLGEENAFVAGWSFGGSLGLHLAECFPHLAGVISGAPMCDLRSHVRRAIETDLRYKEFYDRRFDWNGGCGEAFCFKKTLSHFVPVLLLHGTEDDHCSFTDAKDLFQKAVYTGRPWQMCVIDGAGHYGSSPAHAAKFSSAVRKWLRDRLRKD